MKRDPNCLVFTGGGTGGHVYPGLAVIAELRKSWSGRIVWIGSGQAVERLAVEGAGIEFRSVSAGKFRRSLSFRNVLDLFKIAMAYFQSLAILRELRPALVFSKGGYVSVPPCAAAASLGIPYFTHESDLSPGLATRLNAARAAIILLSWQHSLDYLKPDQRRRSLVSGNPVRAALTEGRADRGRAFLGCPPDRPVILALGGSQGARQVNELVEACLPGLRGRAFVAHQSGPGNPPCRPADQDYHGFSFLHGELADVMAAADIVIGRAGAGTIWESSAAGCPLVLIPLSGADTRGDQVQNARFLAEAGAAVCLTGQDANPERLLAAINRLLDDPSEGRRMAERAAGLMNGQAAADLARLIQDYLGKEAR